MTEVIMSAAAAVADISSGSSLAVGGFGLCGIPETLIEAVAAAGADELAVVSNNCGTTAYGLGILLADKRVRRVTASYVGENAEFARQYLSGELEVELTPQGTLAERLRAGGAGIPAFYTPAGVGTLIADGGMPWRFGPNGSVAVASPPKPVATFAGPAGPKPYVLEEAITTDFALVHALIGDTAGNLVFDKSARNFNPLVAAAGRICIAEVETVVPAGDLDPDRIHLPGIFVDRIVPAGRARGRIEKRTVRSEERK
ncbi:succinyl-CoA--3-ketoacid-CoA transferase [Nocardia sp. 852002-20019_SCH5090214]|uniref:CoA transferase subunit A n=1 Tax=Nocardia sp. 852002-20019_SCH5090214 TaxID=1834087 RepID=UPI0007EA5689|nr:CoA transferase subunit A [Nocardia sp. 852002-20019_SCH5090214]OBA44634.1 succinyl-CoA--3-ketoacid-CoA transferase [Nocardia sp. 852002-20019_SCH5090214]